MRAHETLERAGRHGGFPARGSASGLLAALEMRFASASSVAVSPPAGVRAGKAGGPHGLRVLSPADPGYVEWCRSGMPQRIRLLKLAAEKRRRIEQG